MSKSSLSGILSGTFWGIVSKVLDALAKFATIPMLVAHYGKADYALIALAFSLNAYLRLMDVGMNIGSIRFFSMWVSQSEIEKISAVSRSSMVFYGGIGIINAAIFVVIGLYGSHIFNLQADQAETFKWMMYILAFSTVFNWLSNVVSQLLMAHDELAWISKTATASSILNLVTAAVSISLDLSLALYFLLFTLSTLVVIPFNIFRLKVYRMKLSSLLQPHWDGSAFREILGYSLAIFAMGIFQFSADNLRPVLLGKFASQGITVLTEYRVIQTITMLVIAIGGVFLQVLLPSASKIYAENDSRKKETLVYTGTKYISIFLSFIVFLLIANSKTLLFLYMGEDYQDLWIWLSIWLVTVLLTMHNAPVSSFVLASGKTKPLIFSSAFGCIVSLPITVVLAKTYNVGAAVIGYFIYLLIQMVAYYAYYIPKILKLNSIRLLTRSFLPSLLCGGLSVIVVYCISHFVILKQSWNLLILNSVVFFLSYLGMTFTISIRLGELLDLLRKRRLQL